MINLEQCKQFMAHHEGLSPEELSSVIIEDFPDRIVLITDAKTNKTYEFYQTNKTLKLWNQPKLTTSTSITN